jgi:hypothetical protein
MNIFFDVDETILGYDESLRPLVKQVFQQLIDHGHRIYIWSGVRTGDAVRINVVERHGLTPFVTDCFRKPLFDFREQWSLRGVDVQPDFVVDDYPEIVDAFGGVVVKPYSMARADADMQRVYEAILAHAASNGG